jgi:LysR family transcriptional regulator, transcriptional activator of nhaA
VRHLNYSHLLYFWTVVRQGSIAKASDALHLTPQTISGQLKLLDEAVGEPLFARKGRRLVLSEKGQLVFRYADEIFSLGTELANVVRGQSPGIPACLNVGIVDSIPKLVTYRILESTLTAPHRLRINCQEGALEPLLAELAVHRLDLVLADRPVPAGLNLRAYHHLLGTSGVTVFGAPALVKHYRRNFPGSLNAAPFLYPTQRHALHNQLVSWFDAQDIVPFATAEFDDSALLKIFGQAGVGFFAGPTTIEKEIRKMYHVGVLGRIPDIQERFYAITPERKIKHPAVTAITERAHRGIFKVVDTNH